MPNCFFDSSDEFKRPVFDDAKLLVENFARDLSEKGYLPQTIRLHTSAASHLLCWAEGEDLDIADLDSAACRRFETHFKICQCHGWNQYKASYNAAAIRIFTDYLCKVGVIALPPPKEGNPLLASFRHWMIKHRGLANSTLNYYEPVIAALLEAAGGDPSHLDACGIRTFVLNRTACKKPSSVRNVISPLRTFLRYLIAEGKCSAGLDAAIPTVACWQLSSLPRYLSSADVEHIVAACDPSTPIGSRDRAIILLLSRLGLRAGDIVGMRISDIDWPEGSIRLLGKGRREDRLPLTQEVGDAILVYLEHGRPRIPLGLDHLFLRSKAPIGPFSDSSTVSYIVAQAIRRAGVTSLFRGAHVLRHSAATEMLRQEVPLQDIATILRHRSMETTALYAKVDLALLRLVVQPWPEVMPC